MVTYQSDLFLEAGLPEVGGQVFILGPAVPACHFDVPILVQEDVLGPYVSQFDALRVEVLAGFQEDVQQVADFGAAEFLLVVVDPLLDLTSEQKWVLLVSELSAWMCTVRVPLEPHMPCLANLFLKGNSRFSNLGTSCICTSHFLTSF